MRDNNTDIRKSGVEIMLYFVVFFFFLLKFFKFDLTQENKIKNKIERKILRQIQHTHFREDLVISFFPFLFICVSDKF